MREPYSDTNTGEKAPVNLPLFWRLIRQSRPSPMMLGIALGLSVTSTLLGLAVPLIMKHFVDGFSLTSVRPGQIAWLAAAFVLQAVASGVSLFLLSQVGHQLVASLRDRLWKKLLVLPVSYYNRTESGETLSRLTNDTAVIKNLITENLSGLLTGLISIVGSVAVLFYLDWKMTLLLLIAVPLCMAILMPLGRQMFKISKEQQAETARLTATLSRVISEIRLVKTSGAERREYDNGKNGILTLLRYGIKEGMVQAVISPVIFFVIMLMLVMILGYGGIRVASGELTSGDLIAFILYLFQIVMPINQITGFFTQLQKAMGATTAIISTLEHEEEELYAGAAVQDADLPIALERVTFGYNPGEPVLQDVSFTIPAGKVTAIVGPSGSGKSTLFALLERFYAAESGAVRLGGEPIETYALSSWRSHIGYVSQESPLIAGTIRDNLTYGLPKPVSEQEMKRAAQMAFADGFIMELPEQYDTEVGERGVRLSGGQRQRIAIARALLRNPRILMLDEATSSLDSKSEMMVQQALGRLMQGRTTLVIAHRLATVVHADQIVFLEKGRVTGIGTHEQLTRSHELYREFAAHQLQQPVEEMSETWPLS
ncbi:ABC transporter ATP-binding protein [Paenibacillus hamazuiensis]|uniref:ABC transporter ATP-binding protein n=1 Tax=Paenibacillus hamazuiensis TaxID=2936508 RepID=UPI00200BB347|nr:ABC transporter ATP-binding protein [Paenibacillus hamazuiensis]